MKMTEITIRVPDDVKSIVGEIEEPIYIETIKIIARKKLFEKQQKLKELHNKISLFEAKYGKSYSDFLGNVPDNKKGHDDWIEWTYLQKTADELNEHIEKLKLYLGNEGY